MKMIITNIANLMFHYLSRRINCLKFKSSCAEIVICSKENTIYQHYHEKWFIKDHDFFEHCIVTPSTKWFLCHLKSVNKSSML